MSPNITRWQGLALIGMISVSILWLASTGQLGLYVAPRHELFVTVMAAIGLVSTLISAAAPAAHAHRDSMPKLARVLAGTAAAVSLSAAASMLVVPPATLTSATASQRVINSTADPFAASVDDVSGGSNSNTASFGINDWASILRQSSDPSFYAGREVNTIGFVTADPDDPENMFYVSRFVITHCAIDAQAIGLPIYLENWQNTLQPDEWIDVTGEFATNRSASSSEPIALVPTDLEPIAQPDEPYLYG